MNHQIKHFIVQVFTDSTHYQVILKLSLGFKKKSHAIIYMNNNLFPITG